MGASHLEAPQAMVLAAGLSTRLWPLTLDRAKPAVPFLGRPLVAHGVDWLRKHGTRQIVVNTHYLPESVERALAGFDDLAFSHEPVILGTAGALAAARDRALLSPHRTTVIYNGKLYTELDLSAALEHHRSTGAMVTMILRPNTRREEFREVFVQGDRVVGFGAGRTPETEAPLLFTGIHLIEPEVLAATSAVFSDTVQHIYPPFIERGAVHAFIAGESAVWWEFSTPERYLDLHIEARRLGLAGAVTRSPTSTGDPSEQLENVILWEGARVGSGAELEEVVVGASVHVPSDFRLKRAVVVHGSLSAETRQGRRIGDLLVVPLAGPAADGSGVDSQSAGTALDRSR